MQVDEIMQWRSQKYVLGVQYNILALKALLLLYFLKKILKTPLYLVHSSFGLGGANAPLHLPWLRY